MKHYLRICCFILSVAVLLVACQSAKKTGLDPAKLMEQGKTAEAIEVVEQLAAEGDDRAMVQLGIYYAKGIAVKHDYDKALDWFLRAFSHQNADAFVNLGVMHRDGLGVPRNKKIAYCVFLTTHMRGLGSQTTQYHSNSCLRRIIAELPKDDIKDCLSNYTLGYISAYLGARGKMEGVPDQYKPSEGNPALKDLGWFMESELDAIYGEPTIEEKKAREESARKRQLALDALKHTMVFQVRFPKDMARQYGQYEVITDNSMESGSLRENTRQQKDGYVVSENHTLIWADRHRYVTVDNDKGETLVFKIDHPVKPAPCDWSQWQKAAYALKNRMDCYALLHGKEPKNKTPDLPAKSPELRFRVLKE